MKGQNNDMSLEPSTISEASLCRMIDHTFLMPHGHARQIEDFCRDAMAYRFGAIAVNSSEVAHCRRLLGDADIKIDAAIGYPLGQTTLDNKCHETRDAINNGAAEIDFVMNIRAVQSGELNRVREEFHSIAAICRQHHVLCKAILETCYLSDDEIVNVCHIAMETGIDFVKTSTGLGPAGATVDHVALMKRTVGESGVRVKASGGIWTLEKAMAMIEAGATRIGTGKGPQLIEQLRVSKHPR